MLSVIEQTYITQRAYRDAYTKYASLANEVVPAKGLDSFISKAKSYVSDAIDKLKKSTVAGLVTAGVVAAPFAGIQADVMGKAYSNPIIAANQKYIQGQDQTQAGLGVLFKVLKGKPMRGYPKNPQQVTAEAWHTKPIHGLGGSKTFETNIRKVLEANK